MIRIYNDSYLQLKSVMIMDRLIMYESKFVTLAISVYNNDNNDNINLWL